MKKSTLYYYQINIGGSSEYVFLNTIGTPYVSERLTKRKIKTLKLV